MPTLVAHATQYRGPAGCAFASIVQKNGLAKEFLCRRSRSSRLTMTCLRLSLVWLLALVGAAEAHEITFTVVNLRLEREETQISVELPIKALLHEQPSPLPAGTTEQTFHAGQLPADLRTSLISLLSARCTSPPVEKSCQSRSAASSRRASMWS